MDKVDLNRLKTFYYVALEGSYRKASTYLGIQTSYISKQITSLEETFKIKLFKRFHRSLSLTEEGKEFLKSVQIIMHQLEKMEEVSHQHKQDDEIIRIVTTTGLASLWLIRKLKKFIDLYPNYRFRIITTDEKIDLKNHFADLAILPRVDPHPDIVQKKLHTFRIKLFASKTYLEKFGTPKKPADLDNHRLISFYHNEAGHRGNADWVLKLGAERERLPFLVVNSAVGQYEAAAQSLGIVAIDDAFPYLDARSMVHILPGEGEDIPVYFAAHIEKLRLSKVVALERFLSDDSKGD